MTYGVYTEDLKYFCITEIPLEAAQRLLRKGYVICSEKKVKTGLEISIYFHKYFLFQWFARWRRYVELGFVQISWKFHACSTADKIVERWDGGNK